MPNQTFAAVWPKIESYLQDGISIIPVRDCERDGMPAKTPFGSSWKKYQKEIISKEQLFYEMDSLYNTTAIGMIGGVVSGNLEIIDIDVKYLPGIDAILFTDLQTLYPEIFDIVRIHKTPSGGAHILYRCESQVEGNMKLAGRPAYEDELLLRPKNKTYNFIESRGEGGYVVAPPALGYTILNDRPLPVLTTTQRASLISLCRSYSKLVKVEKMPPPVKSDIDYYDENPFEDFNNRCDPSQIMSDLGWSYLKSNNNFIWYTRPGKTQGVSMSFNLSKRFFYCFTSSTELEESKGYTPSVLISTILHNGNRKETYRYLVQKGYGKIKPQREAQIAKRAATNKKALPPNASASATALHAAISAQLETQHPFGIFWVDDIDKGIIIDREALYIVAEGLGFRLWRDTLTRVQDGIIDTHEQRYFFDVIKDYINEPDEDTSTKIKNSYESFIERHGKFTIQRLPIITDEAILSDTKETCYKCYSNGVLVITATTADLLDYDTIDLYIWKSAIKPRPYTTHTEGKFIDYINLATNVDNHLKQSIGYLCHEYKDETSGYIICVTEECENPEDGGGSGKNVFCKLLSHSTTFHQKPGELVKFDDTLLQSWNWQKVFCISDPPANFNFMALKDLSTGDGSMKRLYSNITTIPCSLMPKFLIPTNYSIEIKDGGLKRRIRTIEFTDFFTKAGGIDVHFGCHFPNGWDDQDWAGYDTFMCGAIQSWLAGAGKIAAPTLSDGGWLKQFRQTYGRVLTGFISEYFEFWLDQKEITNEQFKNNRDTYMTENAIPVKFHPSTFQINKALTEWSKHLNILYTYDNERTVNSIKEKYREFKIPKS